MPNLTDYALAELRQLCSLDLALSPIAPELAKALAAYVPSDQVVFYRLDASGRPARALFALRAPDDEIADRLGALESCMALEPDLGVDATRISCSGRLFRNTGACASGHADPELFRRILAPMGIHAALRMAIRHDGVGLGWVLLARSPGEPSYTAREEKRLAAVEPLLARVLANPHAPSASEWDGEEGLLIADRSGGVQHLCQVACLLRHMIVYPEGVGGENHRAVWERALRELGRQIAASYDGAPVGVAPVWRHGNPRGCFEVRADPLNSFASAEARMVVRVRRFCPEAACQARALSRYRLSPRQREVALFLARGDGNGAVAERLGLRVTTVSGIARDIYQRVGVGSRWELREALLGAKSARKDPEGYAGGIASPLPD